MPFHKTSLCLQHSQGVLEGAEVLDLGPKEQVAQLGEGQEDDDEHDEEPSQVLGTAPQGGGQLSHGLVEADVLEDLHRACTRCQRITTNNTKERKEKHSYIIAYVLDHMIQWSTE